MLLFPTMCPIQTFQTQVDIMCSGPPGQGLSILNNFQLDGHITPWLKKSNTCLDSYLKDLRIRPKL